MEDDPNNPNNTDNSDNSDNSGTQHQGPIIGGQAQGGDQSQQTQSKDWKSMLSEDLKGNPTLQNIKAQTTEEAINSMGKQLVDAQKFVGQDKIPALKPDAEPEERAKWFRENLGVPESSENYSLSEKLQMEMEGEEKEFEIPDVARESFSKIAHEANLTNEQADHLLKSFVSDLYKDQMASQEQSQQKIQQSLANLSQEWGEDFSNRIEIANRALERVADDGLKELLGNNPELANNEAIVKHFYEVGTRLMDDSFKGSSSSMNLNDAAQARTEITRFEQSQEWQDLLSGKLPPQKKANLLQKRNELYATAFPDEP